MLDVIRIADLRSTLSLNVAGKRIGVLTATSTDENELAPQGQHLRWFYPNSLGYPINGVEIFRVSYKRWKDARRGAPLLTRLKLAWSQQQDAAKLSETRWSKREYRLPLESDVSLIFKSKTKLVTTNNGLRLADSGGEKHLVLALTRPVIYCAVTFRNSSASSTKTNIIAFHRSARLASVPMGDQVVVEKPGVTDLLIPLSFDRITGIELIWESDVISALEKKQLGEKVKAISLPDSPQEAYDLIKPDVTAGLSNRMLKTNSMSQVQSRYKENHVAQMVAQLQNTLGQPEATVEAPGGVGQSPFPVTVTDYLDLAAADPNIARMLGSYWTDYSTDDFLYAVRGRFGAGDSQIVYGFCFTHEQSPVPKIKAPITARQLPGIDYRKKQPMARVGLTWDRESGKYMDTAKPVAVDIVRVSNSGKTELTEKAPYLISSRSQYCYRDSVQVNKQLNYLVTPVDFFGRQGLGVESKSLQTKDLDAPVPPKNIRATILQPGMPWTMPAQRSDADMQRGWLTATAEFGEAQRLLSPDATKIRWRYHLGADGGDDPGNWKVLATDVLKPAVDGTVKLGPDATPTSFKLLVSKARVLVANRGDALAVLREADDELKAEHSIASTPMIELLLEHALLEPGLFDSFRVGSGPIRIAGTHAGIPASEDDGDYLKTARLVVEYSAAAASIQDGDVIELHHPFNMTNAQIQNALRSSSSTADYIKSPLISIIFDAFDSIPDSKVFGGEVAIDYCFVSSIAQGTGATLINPVACSSTSPQKQQHTIVGRVVSEIPGDSTSRTFYLRLKPADFLQLKLIAENDFKMTSRYQSPNILTDVKIGINGGNGDIEIKMPVSTRYQTLLLAATCLDSSGKESRQVTSPAEVQIINPPPSTIPAPPYSFDAGRDQPFQMPVPSSNGLSLIHVKWDPIDLQGESTVGVRYELARANGSGLVTSELDRWRRGYGTTHFNALGIEKPQQVSGQLQEGYRIASNNTMFIVQPKNPNDELLLALSQLKGRIRISHSIESNGQGPRTQQLYHKLVRVVQNDGNVELLCQPFGAVDKDTLGTIKASAKFVAEGSPDYSPVESNTNRLRQLADLKFAQGALKGEGRNEGAFGVVTGTPIPETDFYDSVKGSGTGQFFYKVRAVYPGEVRSAWSPASLQLRQVDLTAATRPELVSLQRHDNLLLLRFKKPTGQGVRGLRLLQNTGVEQYSEVSRFTFEPAVDEHPLSPAAIRIQGSLIDFKQLLVELNIGAAQEFEVVGVYPAELDAADFSDELRLDGDGTRRVGGILSLPQPYVGPVQIGIKQQLDITWLSSFEALVEIEIDVSEFEVSAQLYVETIKSIAHDSGVIRLNSERMPIDLGANNNG